MAQGSARSPASAANDGLRPAPVDWVGLDRLDQQLFSQVAEMMRTFRKSASKIWGLGFRPDRKPIMLVRHGDSATAYGYALNVRDRNSLGPDAQLVPLAAELGLPPVYRFGSELARSFGVTENEPAQFACPVGSQECLALAYDVDESHASRWEFVRFLVHESFHQYQMFEMNWRVPRGYDPSVPWVPDPSDSELATREMWYLEAAVTQFAGSGAKDLARSFIEVRSKRHERREDLIALERGHEQIEGSARYVENVYAALNGRSLRLALPTVNEADYQEFASVGRYYRTGARVMELLDRSGILWRHRLADGSDPVSLLEEALNTEDAGDFSEVALDLRAGSIRSGSPSL